GGVGALLKPGAIAGRHLSRWRGRGLGREGARDEQNDRETGDGARRAAAVPGQHDRAIIPSHLPIESAPSLRRPVRGAGGSMYQYLYAIADRLPAAWRPQRARVGGPVALRRLGDLVVLVSQLDRLPEANARTLALHH